MRQRRFLKGSRHVFAVAMVSALALIVENPLASPMSLVKKGTKPQRANTISRSPDSRDWRTMGWDVVGAML
jgi:hypothetical protein